jgi:hypothetical protein
MILKSGIDLLLLSEALEEVRFALDSPLEGDGCQESCDR